MARSRGVEQKLARLRSLRKESASAATLAELKKLLADASNFVVAEAAESAGDFRATDLVPDLRAAFEGFMLAPEDDKLCRAKIAIIEALNKLDHDEEDIFLRAVKHVQIEPGWPESHDAAAALRGSAAFGLVRLRYREVMPLLVDLLVDKEKVARVAAVQALEATASSAAVPLLRFKALSGDAEPEVTCECLTALLKLGPEAVPFVARFLQYGPEAVQEGAALALGETRRPGAFEVLRDFAANLGRSPLQDAVLLAIAMLRSPEALDYLVGLIARKETAAGAVSALAIHRHNDKLRERVAAAVGQARTRLCKHASTRSFARKRTA